MRRGSCSRSAVLAIAASLLLPTAPVTDRAMYWSVVTNVPLSFYGLGGGTAGNGRYVVGGTMGILESDPL